MVTAFLAIAAAQSVSGPPKQQWLLDQNDRRCMVLRERTANSIGVAIETRPFETFHRLIFLLPRTGSKERERSFVGDLSVPHPRPIGKNWVQVSAPPGSPDRLMKTSISTEQLQLATAQGSISITSQRMGVVTAELPGLAKVFGALRECEDEVARKWGKPRTWTKPAVEKTDIRRLIRSDDYPIQLVANDMEGAASVLLRIDESGKPAGCFAHEVEGNRVFAAVVCAVVIKRGQFDPARDANDRPVSSYYLTPLVRFVLE
jgi:hypothetical protein